MGLIWPDAQKLTVTAVSNKTISICTPSWLVRRCLVCMLNNRTSGFSWCWLKDQLTRSVLLWALTSRGHLSERTGKKSRTSLCSFFLQQWMIHHLLLLSAALLLCWQIKSVSHLNATRSAGRVCVCVDLQHLHLWLKHFNPLVPLSWKRKAAACVFLADYQLKLLLLHCAHSLCGYVASCSPLPNHFCWGKLTTSPGSRHFLFSMLLTELILITFQTVWFLLLYWK